MTCPVCQHDRSEALDTRMSKEGEQIRRRRRCCGCGFRWTTYERIAGAVAACSKNAGTAPKIVYVCGSSRFIGRMAVKMWQLEREGILVFGSHLLLAWHPDVYESHEAVAGGLPAVIDELCRRKIRIADVVHVMNVDGYIDERTRADLEYARSLGKSVVYEYENLPPMSPAVRDRQ